MLDNTKIFIQAISFTQGSMHSPALNYYYGQEQKKMEQFFHANAEVENEN